MQINNANVINGGSFIIYKYGFKMRSIFLPNHFPHSILRPFLHPHFVARYNYSIDHEQGRTEKLKRGGGQIWRGANIEKNQLFLWNP